MSRPGGRFRASAAPWIAPDGPAAADKAHPLSNRLRSLWVPALDAGQKQLRNLAPYGASEAALAPIGTGLPTWNSAAAGTGLNFAGDQVAFSRATPFAPTAAAWPWTLAMVLRVEAAPGAADSPDAYGIYPAGANTPCLKFLLDGGTQGIGAQIRNGGATNISLGFAASSIVAGSTYALALTSRTTSDHELRIHNLDSGVLTVNTSTTALAAQSTTYTNETMGGSPTGFGYATANLTVLLAAAWDRGLQRDELQRFILDPFGLLRPERVSLRTVGGPSFTGTGAVSIAGPAVEASGSAEVPSYTGTGAVAISGPALAASGSAGVPDNTGTGAVALAGPALAASGTAAVPSYTGTCAIGVAGPALAGSGLVEILGSGAAAIGGPAISGSGNAAVPAYTATGAASIAGPAVSGSGAADAPAYTGTAAASISGPVVAADGTAAVPDGVAAVSIAGPVIAGEGEAALPILTGAGALAIAGPGLGGTGVAEGLDRTGTAAVALEGPAIASSGVVGAVHTGTGSTALSGPQIAGTGAVGLPDRTGAAALWISAPFARARGSVGAVPIPVRPGSALLPASRAITANVLRGQRAASRADILRGSPRAAGTLDTALLRRP